MLNLPKFVPSSKVREASSTIPRVGEIKKWKRDDVINFLQEKKEKLDLEDEDIGIIRNSE